MNRTRTIYVVICAASLLAGCGGGSTFNVQNPPPPVTKSVNIAFQPSPPASIKINGAATLTAVVNNDSANEGVDWSLSCQGATNCGSLNPSHTASGQSASYAPPSILNSNNQTVQIVAFATADHTKNITAPISINAYGNVLNGTYVIQTSGIHSSGVPYQRAGVIVLDGNGNVTSGEQTVNFPDPNSGVLTSASDAVTTGSYFVGADGRGSLTLVTGDANIGQQGIETFSLVVLSSSSVLLTKTDDTLHQGASNESSTGRLDLQTSTAVPGGGYAFVSRGMSTAGTAMGLGGILNINSPNTISGAGSSFDVAMNDGSGTVTSSSSVSGTTAAPDSLGMFPVSLSTDFGTVQFAAYIIDSAHWALIETDARSNAGFAVSAGVAIGQGSATGTFTAKRTFHGNFIFGIFGQDVSSAPSSLACAGLFTAGSGAISLGYLDETQSGLALEVSDHFHGWYSMDASGNGRVDTNSSLVFSRNGPGPELVFYLTGVGAPALILDADIELNLGGGGAGTGIAFPVAMGTSFAGNYGLTATQALAGTEVDSVGEIAANAGSLSGLLDMNLGFTPSPDAVLTDGFQASTVSGRLTGTWTDSLFPSSGSSTLSIAYYPVDSTQGFVVENDGGSAGANPGNLTFGFYSTRIPVCSSCP